MNTQTSGTTDFRWWQDRHDPRTDQIIRMIWKGMSGREIARVLNVSHQTGINYVERVRLFHPISVASGSLLTLPEVAELTKWSEKILRQCSAEGLLRFDSRNSSGQLLFTHKELVRFEVAGIYSICKVCHTRIPIQKGEEPEHFQPKVLCGDDCEMEYGRRRLAECVARDPAATLTGWRLVFFRRRLVMEHPEKDIWMGCKNACDVSGIKPIQITWLRRRRALSWRPDPKRCYRGVPLITYPESELKLVRQVREECATGGDCT